MLLGNRVTADGARFGGDLAPALVHVGVRAGDRSLLLTRFEVRVPRAMGPGVRSMARAAIPLGQAVIGQAAFRAGCFHGTNCISTAKNFWAKSRFFRRGWFSWNKKTVSRPTDSAKPGQGRRSLGSGPFFGPGVRGGGSGRRGPRTRRRAPRPPGAHQVTRPPGARAADLVCMYMQTRATRRAPGAPATATSCRTWSTWCEIPGARTRRQLAGAHGLARPAAGLAG